MVESAIAKSVTFQNPSEWIVPIAVMTLLSTFKYTRSGEDIVCYSLILVYTSGRTFDHIPDLGDYFSFNLNLFAVFATMFFYSRYLHQNSREMFMQLKRLRQLLALFYNFVKTYHEGLIITTNDTILLYNKEIAKIFEIDKQEKMARVMLIDQ